MDARYVEMCTNNILSFLSTFRTEVALHHAQMMKFYSPPHTNKDYLLSIDKVIAILEERTMNEILLGDEDHSSKEER